MNALDILREPSSECFEACSSVGGDDREVSEASGFMTPVGIYPEPIPIQVRVISSAAQILCAPLRL
jgi:hypothetical protein